MNNPISTITLRNERDVVQARQRAREIAAMVGFDNQEQIRLATATSEMARNAFRYARGGKVTFAVQTGKSQMLEIAISDTGLESRTSKIFLRAAIAPIRGWAWASWEQSG